MSQTIQTVDVSLMSCTDRHPQCHNWKTESRIGGHENSTKLPAWLFLLWLDLHDFTRSETLRAFLTISQDVEPT
jgi:hypothetical protein